MDISYGAEIQLQHANSKMFLNGKIISSQSEKSAYKFELSNYFGAGMIFKILPKYKLRQEGEAVQYHDDVLLS